RQDAEHVGEDGSLLLAGGLGRCGRVSHADFTRQYVCALIPLADSSSRTVPFTVTLQLIWSPSVCAMRLALTVGSVVDKVIDHGSGAGVRGAFASGSK